MAEYIIGFEFIREPDELLEEGAIVETHVHNFLHNTHLTMGTWDVYRYAPIVDAEGKQLMQHDQAMWHALPVERIVGGGPRAIVTIPADMRHKFVLVKGVGPEDDIVDGVTTKKNRYGFYRCVFSHRDRDGKPTEVWEGRAEANV